MSQSTAPAGVPCHGDVGFICPVCQSDEFRTHFGPKKDYGECKDCGFTWDRKDQKIEKAVFGERCECDIHLPIRNEAIKTAKDSIKK